MLTLFGALPSLLCNARSASLHESSFLGFKSRGETLSGLGIVVFFWDDFHSRWGG